MTMSAGELSDSEGLWRFSLAFYARPGVSEALIALQDRARCDVNLMLFALWLGVSGRSRLTKGRMAIADCFARPNETDIVEPMGALRQKLSPPPARDVERLREGI